MWRSEANLWVLILTSPCLKQSLHGCVNQTTWPKSAKHPVSAYHLPIGACWNYRHIGHFCECRPCKLRLSDKPLPTGSSPQPIFNFLRALLRLPVHLLTPLPTESPLPASPYPRVIHYLLRKTSISANIYNAKLALSFQHTDYTDVHVSASLLRLTRTASGRPAHVRLPPDVSLQPEGVSDHDENS